MKRVIAVNGTRVAMRCCSICGIGFGVTRYPDGPFRHAETTPVTLPITLPTGRRVTIPDVCRDCAALLPRRPDLLELLDNPAAKGKPLALISLSAADDEDGDGYLISSATSRAAPPHARPGSRHRRAR